MRYFVVIAVFLLLGGSFLGPVSVVAEAMTASSADTSRWDFECHSYSHSRLNYLNSSEIRLELQRVNSAFQAHGLPVPQHDAYPFGEYNDAVIAVVKQYRKTGRTTSGIMQTYPVPNWYKLKAVKLDGQTAWSTVQSWVDNAIANKELLNIFSHRVETNLTGALTPAMLARLLDYLVSKRNAGQLSVVPISSAYVNYSGRKAVVVVAFDDGWITDYTTVWPLFKARGLVGTSYIYPAALNNHSSGYLTWAMVEEMAGRLWWTDLNKDGTVNIQDMTLVALAYRSRPGDPKWNAAADLDKNGEIDIIDISMVARDCGKTT